jgi:hypothetical protein
MRVMLLRVPPFLLLCVRNWACRKGRSGVRQPSSRLASHHTRRKSKSRSKILDKELATTKALAVDSASRTKLIAASPRWPLDACILPETARSVIDFRATAYCTQEITICEITICERRDPTPTPPGSDSFPAARCRDHTSSTAPQPPTARVRGCEQSAHPNLSASAPQNA